MVLTHENIVSYVEYLLNLRTKSEKISIVITDDKYLIKLADKSYCDGKFPLSDIEQILSSYSRLDKVITNKKQEKCFVFTIFSLFLEWMSVWYKKKIITVDLRVKTK